MELGGLVSALSLLVGFLGSNEHLDWLKTYFNAAELITVQDYRHAKTNVNGSKHIDRFPRRVIG